MEGASLWLKERQHHLSSLFYYTEECSDQITTTYQDKIHYVDLTSRHTLSFATENPGHGYAATINALNPDGNENFFTNNSTSL